MASLHALAAAAGISGIALPLSKTEENNIEAFMYSALSLKVLNIIFIYHVGSSKGVASRWQREGGGARHLDNLG